MKLKGIITAFFIATLVAGCISSEKSHALKRRNVRDYYVSSGVERFYLSDIPTWANFSQTASCQRSKVARFMNYDRLRNSFQLTYEQAIQFQYLLNIERTNLKSNTNAKYLLLKDEEALFYNVSDRIQAGVKSFKAPAYKRVNIIWIDGALGSEEKMKRFKKLMSSKEMDLGHPVFISLCLGDRALKEFISKNGIQSAKAIPFEMFSIYNQKNAILQKMFLSLDPLFKKKQELHFYTPEEEVPEEITGKFKIHRY